MKLNLFYDVHWLHYIDDFQGHCGLRTVKYPSRVSYSSQDPAWILTAVVIKFAVDCTVALDAD